MAKSKSKSKSKKKSTRIKQSSKDVTIDRISDLPEPLLSQILSHLPIESAITTSILSRRWKLLWTSITSLNLDEANISNLMGKTKFTEFVYRVIKLITPRCVHNFRLNCTHILFDPLRLNSWITLIAPTVRELELHLDLTKGNRKLFQFLMNHFNLNKLVVLKLHGCLDFEIPPQASVCFPNLQTLHLIGIRFAIASNSSFSFPNLMILLIDSVKYENEESLNMLLTSCPVLDQLFLRTRNSVNKSCIVISIPSLTRLELDLWCIFDEILMIKLHKLKFLSIISYGFKAIATQSAIISSDFHDLKRLELEVRECPGWCAMIKILLGSMDNLEHLVLRGRNDCCRPFNYWWTEPTNVPKCLVSQITTIAITEMKDDCPAMLEMLRYFIKNAKVLKHLKLGIQPYICSERKQKLMEKISMMFPKGSKNVEIKES